MKTNLTKYPSGCSGLIFNNIIGRDDWNRKDYDKTFPLDDNIKQKLNIKIIELMQQNSEDLVTRTMNNNKIRDYLIFEKIVSQREADKRIS